MLSIAYKKDGDKVEPKISHLKQNLIEQIKENSKEEGVVGGGKVGGKNK